MKLLTKLGLPTLALVALAGTALAGIHRKAASTSHALEEAAVELHDYMHDNYTNSYGAHGMEIAADALHSAIHDYNNGNASEQDVLDQVQAANDARDALRDSFRANGIMADQTAKKLYDECHKLTVRVTAYTNSNS